MKPCNETYYETYEGKRPYHTNSRTYLLSPAHIVLFAWLSSQQLLTPKYQTKTVS